MKYREVTRFLRGQGWDLTRRRDSHEIWESGDGAFRFSVVQNGGEVSPAVVKQLQRVFPDSPSDWN